MGISFYNRLSVRVLFGSIAVLLLLFGLYSFLTVRYYSEQLTQLVFASASRVSDVVKQSTRYSMLLNRREDVYQIITTIGQEPGVDGIRIYNKRGEIMFSTNKSEEGTVVNMNAEACYGCHDQKKPLESLSTQTRMRIYEHSRGKRVLGLINPIRNESSCSDADCHAHPPDRTVLGVLDVRMSLESLDAGIRTAQTTMFLYAAGMVVVVGMISAFFLSLTVLRPVRRLMKGAQAIAAGNLDHRILIQARDELGKLAEAFNEMSASLGHEKEENSRWAETLQQRIREKTEELNAIHRQILHIEKMASLGRLSATVAHELNNPLEAILTYAKLIARRIRTHGVTQALASETLEDIELIARETDRCGTIVKNLLLFSKKQVGEFGLVPVRQIIEKATQLIHHHCEISNVQVQVNYLESGATMMCDENQIQQALVALFVNAVEAMPEGGKLTVTLESSAADEEVTITIADTGVGIANEDMPHIFEPFFSTKKDINGVGLGLSVVYGIVERHGGKVSVASVVGRGTTFTLKFPRLAEGPHVVSGTDQHTGEGHL